MRHVTHGKCVAACCELNNIEYYAHDTHGNLWRDRVGGSTQTPDRQIYNVVTRTHVLQCVAVFCCSVLQRVAVCCSVLRGAEDLVDRLIRQADKSTMK